MNRFLSATKIHSGIGWLPDHTVIEVNSDGEIADLHPPFTQEAEFYEGGVLCPGFVNAHCHLELSHLKNQIPEKKGLLNFLKTVMALRNTFDDAQKKQARETAYASLFDNGTQAVGDICNSTETLDIRSQEKMYLHSFVECLGFAEASAEPAFQRSSAQLQRFKKQDNPNQKLSQSLAPHAPYSVSAALFKIINARQAPTDVLTIHNQEWMAEDEFYKNKTGDVFALLEHLGVDHSDFHPSGKSSLQTYLPLFDRGQAVILVHNTFSTAADFEFAEKRKGNVFYCLCPNANLYIENCLPNLDILKHKTDKVCIGTDSLASNHQLSILSELKTLKQHNPSLSWEILLRWGIHNGAEALHLSQQIGQFKKGKTPGILLLKDIDSHAPSVTRLF